MIKLGKYKTFSGLSVTITKIYPHIVKGFYYENNKKIENSWTNEGISINFLEKCLIIEEQNK